MTYASWISKMRVKVGDNPEPVHVDWTADGSSNVFQMPADTFPVLDDGSYVVKVAGSTKTETTDFTLNKETGKLTILSTPTLGQAVTIDSNKVNLLNATWLTITNDVIRSLGDDFWKEIIDDAKVTTANMVSLTMDDNVIAVYDFFYKESTSVNYRPVESFCNWRYSRDENKIYLSDRESFPIAGQALRIRVLKTYVIGDETTDTLDLQDKFLTILEYGSEARYWEYRYKDVVELVSKQTTESSRTPLQELMMLNDRAMRKYEMEKAKLKPAKPPRRIPGHQEGKGSV